MMTTSVLFIMIQWLQMWKCVRVQVLIAHTWKYITNCLIPFFHSHWLLTQALQTVSVLLLFCQALMIVHACFLKVRQQKLPLIVPSWTDDICNALRKKLHACYYFYTSGFLYLWLLMRYTQHCMLAGEEVSLWNWKTDLHYMLINLFLNKLKHQKKGPLLNMSIGSLHWQ